MFESAEVAHELDEEAYEAEVPALRQALLEAQYELLDSERNALVIVVGGVDGAGKGDAVNLLQTWLDPRHAWVFGIEPPDVHEALRPPYYRFWKKLPPRGKTAILVGSWHSAPILDRAHGRIGDAELDARLERIRAFERMLVEEGVVLLKLWFHLSKKQQKKRLQKLEKNDATRWRVTERDWEHYALYDDFVRTSARALRETSTGHAPWVIVPGAEPRYRQITVGRAVLQALRAAPVDGDGGRAPVRQPAPPDGKSVLSVLGSPKKLDKKHYRRELERLQGRLALAFRSEAMERRALVALFEGWDAAGKGGAIRRVTAALDARTYQVVPIAAPSDEERARPYLWRFWRHVPRHGKATLFDRSWYGRVLVERVEGYAEPAEWMRAYHEINELEEQLVDHGIVVVKLWLHIDPDEQLRRFRDREATGFKRFKITDEDWRNREKWGEYERAVTDMVDRTSTEIAPWTLVPANDKRHARLTVLRTLVERLEQSFG